LSKNVFDLFARRKKMKKLLLLGLVVSLFYATTASAVILQPGNAGSAGGFAFTLLGYQEPGQSETASGDVDQTAYSALVSYGITDRLAATVGYIMANQSGDGLDLTVDAIPPLGIPVTSGTIGSTVNGFTLGLGYNIFDDLRDGTPVAIKITGYYTSVAAKNDMPSNLETLREDFGALVPAFQAFRDQTIDTSIWDARIIVSKVIIPFLPYAGFKYGSSNSTIKVEGVSGDTSADATFTEFTLGSGLFFSQQMGILLEYVMKNTSSDGNDRSTSQYGISFNYIM
jgi:hypothetical protein